MGNSLEPFNGIYNVKANNPDRKDNESDIYRHPGNPKQDYVFSPETLQEIMKNLFKTRKPTSTVFEQRTTDSEGNLTKKTFKTNYKEFKSDAEMFGRGLLELDLVPWREEYKDYKLRFMGVYAKNSYRYFVEDMACIMHNVVSVPIYDTLGEEATVFAFSNTNMASLCLTTSHFKNMLELKKTGQIPKLENFIIIDDENWEESFKEDGKAVDVNVFSWNEVLEAGKASSISEWVPVTKKDIYCFSYTSGTTGTPKGAMLSQYNIATTIQATHKMLDCSSKDKHLSYLPLAHVMERLVALTLMAAGCSIGIFGGNIKKIKEDLAIFKPTIFVSVPRLFNRFYDVIQQKLKDKEGTFAGNLAQKAIRRKLKNLEKDGEVTHKIYDMLVFSKMKKVLGGRVRFMVTGSAPLNKDVANFLKIAMCCPMVEGYGQTEGTAAEFGMRISDTTSGHVGGILYHNEFKLVDVESMKYTSKDIDPETGIERPRGEIWVRGEGVIPGYYKNDKKNEETFTEDGWLQSGDIGMIVPPSNKLVIIDRKKNIFKLSQGEYIAPEKLEGNYKTCTPLISDIYIYGDSFKSCVIAVITVEPENQRKLADLMNVCNDVPDDQLLENSDFEKGVLLLFKQKAKEIKFNGLEIPRAVIMQDKPFADLGLLTTSFKMKRNEVKDHFLEALNQRYEKLY